MTDETNNDAPADETVLDFDADTEASNESGIDSDGGPEEPTVASLTIAKLGLLRMSLQELKEKAPADLQAFAESLDVENANGMRKQDMMFAALKILAEEGVEISGSGTMEVLPDG